MGIAKLHEFELEELLFVHNGLLKYRIFFKGMSDDNLDKSRDSSRSVSSHVVGLTLRMIESITTSWEGWGNPIWVSKICKPREGL